MCDNVVLDPSRFSPGGTPAALWRGMTIQPPPNDDRPPPMPETDPTPVPIGTPDEPEQRAPGQEDAPMGAPRDEPDPDAR